MSQHTSQYKRILRRLKRGPATYQELNRASGSTASWKRLGEMELPIVKSKRAVKVNGHTVKITVVALREVPANAK